MKPFSKTYKKLLPFVITCLLISSTVFAQNNPEVKQEVRRHRNSIETQFDNLIDKSIRYLDFKMIKQGSLDILRSNVSDSLNVLKQELKATEKLVFAQTEEMAALKMELKNTLDAITSLQKEKNIIAFLGIPIEKKTYTNIMWSISGALFLFMLYFMYRFKRSNRITLDSIKTISEIQNEFDSYKKRALEKEQKLARELQNELNKSIR